MRHDLPIPLVKGVVEVKQLNILVNSKSNEKRYEIVGRKLKS